MVLPERTALTVHGRRNSPMKIGRSAITGRFMPVKVAKAQKETSVVETIKVKKGK
jgi:hypothetical protein